MSKKLRHIGPGYSGGSPEGPIVNANTGDVVEVGDAKAAQLFADFPKEWEEVVVEPAETEPVRSNKKGRG